MQLNPMLMNPLHGTLSGTLFENPSRNIERSLFWDIYFDFEEFELRGRLVRQNCIVDWIKVSEPTSLFEKRMSFSSSNDAAIECSIYFDGLHNFADKWSFELQPNASKKVWLVNFDISAVMSVLDDRATRERVRGSTTLSFDGFHIVKSNFTPPAEHTSTAERMVSEFFPLPKDTVVHDRDFKYVIEHSWPKSVD
jgi:hypothetical protein